MEREAGIEPATNSLEGCDSTVELLPQSDSIVENVGTPPVKLKSYLMQDEPGAGVFSYKMSLEGRSVARHLRYLTPRAGSVSNSIISQSDEAPFPLRPRYGAYESAITSGRMVVGHRVGLLVLPSWFITYLSKDIV